MNQEALRSLRTLVINFMDIGYLAPRSLWLAETYEKLGNPQAALLHYWRFVELWEDCDLELRPLVEEAQRAIHRLDPAS